MQFCTACTAHERIQKSVAHLTTQFRHRPLPFKISSFRPQEGTHHAKKVISSQFQITAVYVSLCPCSGLLYTAELPCDS